MIDEIYNKHVLRLAADISRTEPLAAADAVVSLNSPLCGSTIRVELALEGGRIAGYAHKVKACALGQATASVMAARAIGRSRDEIAVVADRMAAMLATGGAPPAGDWSALAALAPAKDATSRHGAIMLPFKAVLRAFDEASAAAEN